MNLIYRIVFVLTCLVSSWASAQQTPVIVYTGQLNYAKGQKTQLARVFFIKRQVPNNPVPAITAFVMLYLGAPGSPEYVSLYYDPVAYNPDNREMLLQRNDDLRGRRLPTIRLRFDENGKAMSGPFYSQTEGYQGEFSLQQGWDQPKASMLSGVGGLYSGQCRAQGRSSLTLQGLELIPSRIFAERMAPEGAFMETNYLGTGLCRYTGLTNCVSFNSGVYNFYTDTLTLMQGAWTWKCQRRGNDTLTCNSPRYPNCELKRHGTIVLEKPKENRGTTNIKTLAITDEPAPIPSATSCQDWDGISSGILHHQQNARTQPISLRLTTFASSGGKCQATGTATLYFTAGSGRWEKIAFPIPSFELNTTQARQLLFSDNYTDLVLDLQRHQDGSITGSWYSRLYGFVGEIALQKGTSYPRLSTSSLVPGLSATYALRDNKKRSLHITTTEAGFDKTSHDPYVQLSIGGASMRYMETLGQLSDGIQGGSYDYFTNFLVMRTSGTLFYGLMGQNYIKLRGQPRSHLSIAHSLETEYVYDRQP